MNYDQNVSFWLDLDLEQTRLPVYLELAVNLMCFKIIFKSEKNVNTRKYLIRGLS